jgi:hypothetical protein
MFMSTPCPLHKSVLIFSCGLFRNTDFLFRLVSKRFRNNETNLIFCFAKMTETDPKQNEHQFVSVRTGTNNYLFRGHANFKPSRKTLINIKYQHSTSGLSSPLSHPVAIYTVQIKRSFFTSLHYSMCQALLVQYIYIVQSYPSTWSIHLDMIRRIHAETLEKEIGFLKNGYWWESERWPRTRWPRPASTSYYYNAGVFLWRRHIIFSKMVQYSLISSQSNSFPLCPPARLCGNFVHFKLGGERGKIPAPHPPPPPRRLDSEG